MRYFAVVFEYADGRFSNTRNRIGVYYIKAKSMDEAKEFYGYGGVLYIREVTLDQIALSGSN